MVAVGHKEPPQLSVTESQSCGTTPGLVSSSLLKFLLTVGVVAAVRVRVYCVTIFLSSLCGDELIMSSEKGIYCRSMQFLEINE